MITQTHIFQCESKTVNATEILTAILTPYMQCTVINNNNNDDNENNNNQHHHYHYYYYYYYHFFLNYSSLFASNFTATKQALIKFNKSCSPFASSVFNH